MTNSDTTPQHCEQEREKSLRRKLGIPDDAERVIIFAESSHWDPNWKLTSEEYFHQRVVRNLDRAINELLQEPQRVYSVECVFFLRMYWERRPQQQNIIRTLVNEGRLRLTNSGVTTADTLLPDTEAILRDLLIGQEWLRANGMTQEPKVAYFPDSFGHSPALPSILNAAGFNMAAITRIDGMFFIGADYEQPSHFPRLGSSAALLLKKERTLDFVWCCPDGAKVLCHWNAFNYGQGDLLAHRGITRVKMYSAVPDRSNRNVSHKVKRFAAQLAPYSRTPYLFCPIGFDFVRPIANLVTLLDRYNRTNYPKTGIWTTNAGLDDYLSLVSCYRTILPAIELDPNPYWMGFYTSRPSLKKRCYQLVDSLQLAEHLSLLPDNSNAEQAISEELKDAWWIAVVSNHHDFITGTSRDRVVNQEQIPWLEQASTMATAVISRLTSDICISDRQQHPVVKTGLPQWNSRNDNIEVRTPHFTVELSEGTGGGITRVSCPATQRPLLTGISNDLINYKDSGGLWRMGHEYRGGTLEEVARASDSPARLQVRELNDSLEISCVTQLDGQTVHRTLWFYNDTPVIRFRVEGRAAKRRTVTVRFNTSISADQIVMDTPGGVIRRPIQKYYDPTFWPTQHFAHIQGNTEAYGLGLFLDMPGAISYHTDGHIELVALRNATREKAYGFLPLLAMPVTTHEHSVQIFDYALLFTSHGDWRENDIPIISLSIRDKLWAVTGYPKIHELAYSIVTTNRSDVVVTTIKPASRGDGLIIRLYTLTSPGEPVTVTMRDQIVKTAFLCDARERDLKPLEICDGSVHLTMPGTIGTVRLLT